MFNLAFFFLMPNLILIQHTWAIARWITCKSIRSFNFCLHKQWKMVVVPLDVVVSVDGKSQNGNNWRGHNQPSDRIVKPQIKLNIDPNFHIFMKCKFMEIVGIIMFNIELSLPVVHSVLEVFDRIACIDIQFKWGIC